MIFFRFGNLISLNEKCKKDRMVMISITNLDIIKCKYCLNPEQLNILILIKI